MSYFNFYPSSITTISHVPTHHKINVLGDNKYWTDIRFIFIRRRRSRGNRILIVSTEMKFEFKISHEQCADKVHMLDALFMFKP